MKTKILADQISKCSDFASGVTPKTASYYSAERNDHLNNEPKNLLGKLGECAFFNIARGLDLCPSEPDFTIFQVCDYRRNFDADIVLGSGKKVHVKSNFDPWPYGRLPISWMMSVTDPMFHSTMKDDEYIALMKVSKDYSEATLFSLFKISDAKKKFLFVEPKIQRFIGKKKVIEQNLVLNLFDDIYDREPLGLIEKETA